MKTPLLVLLAVVLLACPLALADGIDNFVWSSPAGQTFSWTWPASAPDSQFTFLDGGRIFTDGSLMYDAYLSEFPCSPFVIGGCVDGLMSQIMFSCVSNPQNCDTLTTYWENFAATFFTYSGGVITFIPGKYVPAPGVTDQWGATMTITPAPEPGSLKLLLAGLALIFVCNWLRRAASNLKWEAAVLPLRNNQLILTPLCRPRGQKLPDGEQQHAYTNDGQAQFGRSDRETRIKARSH